MKEYVLLVCCCVTSCLYAETSASRAYISRYANGATNNFVESISNIVVAGRSYARDGAATGVVTNGCGTLIECYENGTNRTQYCYLDGRKHGTETAWFRDGSVRYVRGYNNGERHGTWTHYFPNGMKESEIVYEFNKEKSKKVWDEQGKEVLNTGDSPEE